MTDEILKAVEAAQDAVKDMRYIHGHIQRMLECKLKSVRREVFATLITEECPQCDRETTLRWDTKKDGCFFYCPYCGAKVKLCSACLAQGGGDCDWDSETRKCKLDKEETE